MLFDKNINDITEEDINYLIDNNEPENKQLEYKRELPNTADSKKNTFLKEIVAFSNTSGGIIIVGISQNKKEKNITLFGIHSESEDQDLLHLNQIIRNGIEPSIIFPEIRSLVINNEKIYIIKVLPSFNKPHWLTANKKFYGRHSNGVYDLGIPELRTLFLSKETIKEKVENSTLNENKII